MHDLKKKGWSQKLTGWNQGWQRGNRYLRFVRHVTVRRITWRTREELRWTTSPALVPTSSPISKGAIASLDPSGSRLPKTLFIIYVAVDSYEESIPSTIIGEAVSSSSSGGGTTNSNFSCKGVACLNPQAPNPSSPQSRVDIHSVSTRIWWCPWPMKANLSRCSIML